MVHVVAGQVVPGLAFNFCFYDSFKHLAASAAASSAAAQARERPAGAAAGSSAGALQAPEPSAVRNAACACLAGLCTSTITFPLDVVRRRKQVGGKAGVGLSRSGSMGGWRRHFRWPIPPATGVLHGKSLWGGWHERSRSWQSGPAVNGRVWCVRAHTRGLQPGRHAAGCRHQAASCSGVAHARARVRCCMHAPGSSSSPSEEPAGCACTIKRWAAHGRLCTHVPLQCALSILLPTHVSHVLAHD